MSIASNRYNLQLAVQPARGIYPTTPTFFYECKGVGLQPKPTISRLEITDGRLWSPSLKKVTYLETGGQPDLIGQPNGLGAFIYGMLGACVSTPGTPDNHVFTPAPDLSDFPYFTIWNFFDDHWHLFRDCQVIGGEFTVGVDNPWSLIRPIIVGMAPMEYVDEPATEATEEEEWIHWLDGGGGHFLGGDYQHAYMPALPQALDDVKTVLAAFKTTYNLHLAVATGLHHKAADATNGLVYATPVADEAAAIAACTEIRTKYLDHLDQAGVHYFDDVVNPISHADPTDTATCITFLQELLGAVNTPGCYNRHVGGKAGARSLTMAVDLRAQPIQGEAVVPYVIKRKRGSINVAVDLMLEDFELINLALFGDPNPAFGTQMTTKIQRLSMYNRFVAQMTPEISLAFDVPQFDFDPEPMYGVTASPAGDEVIVPVGGECSGAAGSEITVTLKNSVAGY